MVRAALSAKALPQAGLCMFAPILEMVTRYPGTRAPALRIDTVDGHAAQARGGSCRRTARGKAHGEGAGRHGSAGRADLAHDLRPERAQRDHPATRDGRDRSFPVNYAPPVSLWFAPLRCFSLWHAEFL